MCGLKAIFEGKFSAAHPSINRKINLFFNRWTIVELYELEYFETMITLLQPKPGGWFLMIGLPSKNSTGISAIVQLTKKGPLRVLDCAGYFQEEIQAQKKHRRNSESMDRGTIAQAETADQVLEALKEMRADQTEFIVLDMLRPFFTSRGDLHDSKAILKACIRQMDRLAKKANGIVTVSPSVVP